VVTITVNGIRILAVDYITVFHFVTMKAFDGRTDKRRQQDRAYAIAIAR